MNGISHARNFLASWDFTVLTRFVVFIHCNCNFLPVIPTRGMHSLNSMSLPHHPAEFLEFSKFFVTSLIVFLLHKFFFDRLVEMAENKGTKRSPLTLQPASDTELDGEIEPEYVPNANDSPVTRAANIAAERAAERFRKPVQKNSRLYTKTKVNTLRSEVLGKLKELDSAVETNSDAIVNLR